MDSLISDVQSVKWQNDSNRNNNSKLNFHFTRTDWFYNIKYIVTSVSCDFINSIHLWNYTKATVRSVYSKKAKGKKSIVYFHHNICYRIWTTVSKCFVECWIFPCINTWRGGEVEWGWEVGPTLCRDNLLCNPSL